MGGGTQEVMGLGGGGGAAGVQRWGGCDRPQVVMG